MENERGYQVLPQGLSVSRALTLDEWRACGAVLTAHATRITWAIGDWLVYGSGRGDYGEFYVDARTITGRSFESLSQCARVSKTFPIAQRSVAVPWSFYREALRLPEAERERTLCLALSNQWTRDGLAAFISTRDGAQPTPARALSEAPSSTRVNNGGWHNHKSHHKVMQCPSCGFKFEPKRRKRVTLVLPQAVDAVGQRPENPT